MINGKIQQEDRALVNIYTPNIGALKYVEQILMDIKGKMEGKERRERQKYRYSRGF